MADLDRIIIEDEESDFDVRKEAKKTRRVLVFRLGAEHYCIDITEAREVFKPGSITKVPNTPPFIVGVTNLHGAAVPLVDIRFFLGLQGKEGLASNKVIVTDVQANTLGVLVDDVDQALDIEEGSIQPPLATIKGALAAVTKGQVQLGKEIVVLLDLKKILSCEELESLKKGE